LVFDAVFNAVEHLLEVVFIIPILSFIRKVFPFLISDEHPWLSCEHIMLSMVKFRRLYKQSVLRLLTCL